MPRIDLVLVYVRIGHLQGRLCRYRSPYWSASDKIWYSPMPFLVELESTQQRELESERTGERTREGGRGREG